MTATTSRFKGYVQLGAREPGGADPATAWLAGKLDAPEPGEAATDELEERFVSLRDRWRRETFLLSSIDEICTHEAYQRIIGLGESALPLILRDLEKSPGHWFWALRAITGETPEGGDIVGDVEAMARRWTDWGRANGLL